MQIDISSGPCAFWMLRDLISLSMSSFSNDSDDSLELVLYEWVSGITLLFANVVHCEAKKLLRRSAFCLKVVIKVFLCSKGRMSGIFFTIKWL